MNAMNRRKLYVTGGSIVLVAALVVVAAFVVLYLRGGSGQASAPISAPALAASNSTQQHFRIDPNSSQVQFTLTEDLFNKPNTVVGKTNQVAGDIVIDLSQPSKSQIGTIRIDARTLATDSGMRDRMIRSAILESGQDQYEFINFVPTEITGLPDKVEAGQTYSFKVAGSLTVRSVTKPVTFDVTAKLVSGSPQRLEGTATTTVHRADFNLQIPNVPTVANVSDDVKLEISFVAPEASATAAATQSAAS
jgi:polyisoprenoid-binding protein YceI